MTGENQDSASSLEEIDLINDGVDVEGAPVTEDDEMQVLAGMYTEVDGVFLDGE